MKHIMISIRPEYVCKILNKEKTLEIRKNIPREWQEYFNRKQPKPEPIQVEIYCTKGKPYLYRVDDDNNFELSNKLRYIEDSNIFVKDYNDQNGKVVTQFTLNDISIFNYGCMDYPTPSYDGDPSMCKVGDGYFITCGELEKTCLTYNKLLEYGKGKTLYGWHIDNLEIYDTPRELREFEKNEIDLDSDTSGIGMYSHKKLTRPFQSWGYLKDET